MISVVIPVTMLGASGFQSVYWIAAEAQNDLLNVIAQTVTVTLLSRPLSSVKSQAGIGSPFFKSLMDPSHLIRVVSS